MLLAADWQAIGALGSAVAAIGALAVVILTVGMARSAQRSADAALDAATGAWRPLLLPHRVKVVRASGREQAAVQVEVRNIGRGPALDIRMTVDGRGESFEQYPTYIAEPGTHIDYRGLRIPSASTECQVAVSYRDISGRSYVSRAHAYVRQPQRPPTPGASVEVEGYLRDVRFEALTQSR